MARAEVVQIRCDRCKRVELVPKGPPKERPDFEARFADQTLVYDDICPRCSQTMQNLWKDMAEWERDVKQGFLGQGPAVLNNQAPPLEVAPDYTPPKPHSAAAAKK
jgi:hypothetical protein